jgi:SAM-dependent methyltransferase
MSRVVTAMVNSRFRDGAFWLQDKWIDWNERRFNIQTAPTDEDLRDRWMSLRVASKYNDGLGYSAPDYANIFKLAKILRPGMEDVFYDVGCGRGRVLCVMATYGMAKVVGVELVQELCVQARLNAASLRGCRTAIELRCGDACHVDLSEGTIYFFYNPFGPSTFREVLNRIRNTLDQSYRMIRIVYYLAEHENIFYESGWLEKYADFKTRTGRVVSFWRSQP